MNQNQHINLIQFLNTEQAAYKRIRDLTFVLDCHTGAIGGTEGKEIQELTDLIKTGVF